MNKVRLGVIGMGSMGSSHVRYLTNGEVNGVELTAICDGAAELLEQRKQQFGEHLHAYTDVDEMMGSGNIDAVLIATPHFSHPELAIKAFDHGLHVLVEKPAGVHTKQVRQMNEKAKASGKVFSIMYNQRTDPLYQKVRDLVVSGELGEIRRTNWIVTTWYRPQCYYEQASWRATWAGEGGGVLINQCPHQLDLWCWTIDMLPSRVRAFCHFGKRRAIEVEDEVTAYVEYPNGGTGVFVTSIAEAPGTNRYEIVGDRGTVVIENDKLSYHRLPQSETQVNAETKEPFCNPESWNVDIPIKGKPGGHKAITQNFVDAILHQTPLIAPGEEGINGLTLSNAMHLSTWQDDWVELPFNDELYYEKLQEKIKTSSFKP